MTFPLPGTTYDRQTARYRRRAGGLVSSEDVRIAIDADIDRRKLRFGEHAKKVATAGDNLVKGTGTRLEYERSVANWFEAMSQEIKALHLADMAAGKGGFDNLNKSDLVWLLLLIGIQFRSLRKRRRALLENPRYGASPEFARQCEADGEVGRGTYEAVAEKEDRRAGNVYTYNLLSPHVVHCHGRKSCIAMTIKGVVHVNEMLPVGQRVCGQRCRCKTPRFKTRQEAEASWTLAGLVEIVEALRTGLGVTI